MKCRLNVVTDEKIGFSAFRKCCLYVSHVLYALHVLYELHVLSAYMIFLHCLSKTLFRFLCCMFSVFNCIHSLKIAKYVYQLRVVCIALCIVRTFDIVTFVRIKSIVYGFMHFASFKCVLYALYDMHILL